MTNRTAHALPNLSRFTRPADDPEAQASLEADMEEAHRAASLLGECDPFVRAAVLLGSAGIALERGEQPWAPLDAAERVISDLRLEHGCESWESADWSKATTHDVSTLHDACGELRRRARQLRDARLAPVRKAVA